MHIGFFLPQAGGGASPTVARDVAQAAEASGADSVWAGDHLVLPMQQRERYPFNPTGQFPVSPERPWLEPFTLLAYLAGQTSRVRLGTSVCILPYRHPIENAKMAADLDFLSDGRLIFGAGAGWWAEEFDALGVPFHERGARSDEQLAAITRLWTEPAPRFDGRHYRFNAVALEPKPVQRPRPPIWIGGNALAAARRAGRFGEAWHPAIYGVSPEQAAAGLAVARDAARRVGREPAAIGLALWAPVELSDATPDGEAWERGVIAGPPGELARVLGAYARAGASGVVLVMGGNPEQRIRDMERVINEVAPGLAAPADE